MKLGTLKIVSIAISVVLLSGCLSGTTNSSSPPAATYNASAYFNKTSVGNTWTLTGTLSESGILNSTSTVSDTYVNTAFTGGVITQTDN